MVVHSFDDVLRSADAHEDTLRVAGLVGSARAWALTRWVRHFQKPLVVLCPDNETCAELVADGLALATLVPDSRPGATGIDWLQLPAWEHSLYSGVSPSIRIRLQRAATLGQLARQRTGDSPNIPIIVTTLAAALLHTISPVLLDSHTLRFAAGASCGGRETVIASLIAAGYLRVDTVEDPGTFSARGDLIDIFTPGHDDPIRIELFDDVVERMRSFDPSSQRTHPEHLEGLVASPARELLMTAEIVPALREAMKLWADDAAIPRSVRDPVLESAVIGQYADHSEAWPAFAYEPPTTFFDHLPKDHQLAIIDDLSCQQLFDQLLADEMAAHEQLVAEPLDCRRLAPPPTRLYVDSAAATQRLMSRARTIFSGVSLTDASSLPSTVVDGDPSDVPPTQLYCSIKTNSDLSVVPTTSLDALEEKFQLWQRQAFRVLLCAPTRGQADRLSHLLSERGLEATCHESPIGSGFRWPAERLVVITEGEVLGGVSGRRRAGGKSRTRAERSTSQMPSGDWAGLQALSDLSPGDTVVHVHHGIGRYRGLSRLALSGAPADFLLIEYAGNDKLYLPVHRLNLIQKHGAAGDATPLDKLGSQQFQKTKDRVKAAVRELAVDLVRIYAERKIRTGFRFSPRDASFEAFEAGFAYEETPDQAKAIDDTIHDMVNGRIMDRLICGDVGYGKTEVAIRAAYKAVMDGKQVAVLVPTTLLAQQHEHSFKTRLQGLPVNVDSLSRFKSAREQKSLLGRLKEGKVDIIIGTHRLLSRDVAFRDLGLLVVDEEHRFGVEHKEKIKAIKLNVPVITLTATPIPRTLHMALSGLREISLIRTPPVNRLPIRTFISKLDDELVRKAIEFELSRGGQVFFLHNRVQTIADTAATIRRLVPGAKITVAHGQMSESELESAVREFYERRTNVLVCTSIIESGIDLPSANTILIDRADTFGLAQLYQIRGRVGRGQQRGYAYLLVPSERTITDDARKRLEVIQRFVELGSGFSVASHDLEIRGGGELLGANQSGNIQAVGFDLYLELLEEAVREIQAGGGPAAETESTVDPEIKAPFPAFLPEEFVPDVHQRLSLYRRLSSSRSDDEVDQLEEEIQDRFGRLPAEAMNLLWLIRTKVHLKRLEIDAVTVGPERIVLVPGKSSALDPVRAIALVSAHPDRYQLTPDSRFVAKKFAPSMRELYFAIQDLLRDLAPRESSALR